MTNTPNRPDLDLNAIEQRAAVATKGPWKVELEQCDCSDGLCSHGTYVSAIYADGQRRTDFTDFSDADWQFIIRARTAVPALAAEIRRLRAALKQIRHLHTDSPMGPCPLCINADAVVAGGDGLHPWPCPTARLTGAQDFDPPSFRAAQAASACPGFEKEHQGVSDAKRRLANCKHCGQPRTAHAAGVVVPAASEETGR